MESGFILIISYVFCGSKKSDKNLRTTIYSTVDKTMLHCLRDNLTGLTHATEGQTRITHYASILWKERLTKSCEIKIGKEKLWQNWGEFINATRRFGRENRTPYREGDASRCAQVWVMETELNCDAERKRNERWNSFPLIAGCCSLFYPTLKVFSGWPHVETETVVGRPASWSK